MKLPLTMRLAYCSRKKKGGFWLLRGSTAGSLDSKDMAVAERPGDRGICCEEEGARLAGLCMVGEGVVGLP
jgi:hypothetical protein